MVQAYVQLEAHLLLLGILRDQRLMELHNARKRFIVLI